MESKKIVHFLYCPFTGLGLYGGHRGQRWLRNRIKIFKQFVIPSLVNQINQDFILWVSFRHQDHSDSLIKEFHDYLEREFKVVFTYSGVCFWDDKYPDDIAKNRLVNAVHGSMGELINAMGDAETILMTIQPSDDLYHEGLVIGARAIFEQVKDIEAFGFYRGYVMNYLTNELAEWNPTTIPPFFTIKFPRETFIDPLKHVEYTGPYKSHEYVGDKLKFGTIQERGFIVGTHGENISTVFNHPFANNKIEGKEKEEILKKFGILNVPKLKLKVSFRKIIMRKLPVYWQKKLRYLLGERFFARIYDFLRS